MGRGGTLFLFYIQISKRDGGGFVVWRNKTKKNPFFFNKASVYVFNVVCGIEAHSAVFTAFAPALFVLVFQLFKDFA